MYVKMNSWHIVNGDKTLCGKIYSPGNQRSDDFGNDKSCENCFRIQAKNAARPA